MRTPLILSALSALSPMLAMAATTAADAHADVPLARRVVAASATARQAAACVAAQPFYWEIGDGRRALAGASVGQDAPEARTQMALASASKWLYGAYVAERRQGVLTDADVRFLSFRSGYTRFKTCLPGQTVGDCQASRLNGGGDIDGDTIGRFDYNGGHMQKHATIMGLGPLNNAGLAAVIRNGLGVLGPDWQLSYSQPQLAGGGVSSAYDYGRFLRATLRGELKMHALLGSHAVCANPLTCPAEAIKTPIPTSETWHYAIGHWVEDDPVVGDGAFSSPGAFGFYPWIDASQTFYGILARDARNGVGAGDTVDKPATQSVDCGRLIRAAWVSGQAQP